MSARTALLAALLAASLAPAAQAVGGALAVALSLSKPEQYRFVVPVETNRLAGVGMGADAPSDAPLRYEDAAFLAELYKERHYFASRYATSSTESISEVIRGYDISWDGIGLAVFYHDSLVGDLHDGTSAASGFIVATNIASKAVRATRYDTDPSPASAWLDLCGGESPFAYGTEPSLREDVGGGEPLASAAIAKLYADAEKLRRAGAVFFDVIKSNKTYVTAHNTQNVQSTWITGYGESGEFYYGVDSASNPTFTNKGFKWSRSAAYTARRQKSIGWKFDRETETWAQDTAVTESSRKSSTVQLCYPQDGLAYIPFRNNKTDILSGRTRVTKVTAFAHMNFLHERLIGTNVVKKVTGTFLYPVNGHFLSLDETPQIAVEMHGIDQMSAVYAAFGLFGDTLITSADSLLEEVPAAPDPPDRDALSGYMTYAESPLYEYRYEISLCSSSPFYVVLDVDFNARVTGGGE